MVVPEYAEIIVVGVILQGRFAWYITDKNYWIMDIEKMMGGYKKRGYAVEDFHENRFGIKILSHDNANEFFEKIKGYDIPSKELRDRVNKLAEEENTFELEDYVPSLLVNFDEKRLISSYPESISFEEYVPKGWGGEYSDFLELIPTEYQYWLVGDKNLFKEYL